MTTPDHEPLPNPEEETKAESQSAAAAGGEEPRTEEHAAAERGEAGRSEAEKADEKQPEFERAMAERDAADAAVQREFHWRTRRSFLVGLIAAGTGYGAWRWLVTQPKEDGIVWPVRRVLKFNERISGKLFDPRRRIAELPASALTPGGPRVNGDIGLVSEMNFSDWRLRIAGTRLALTLEQLRTLPEVSQITPLNCIEGFTTVARWTGVRFADFVNKFYPEGRKKSYVGLVTPDGEYYVGLDSPSAFHPQTLLCYAINGEPVSIEHGAPLRLLIPTKYGIKNLKRVGTIRFTDQRPPDYWAERGYDWFAGF